MSVIAAALSIALVGASAPAAKCGPSHWLPGASEGEPTFVIDGAIVEGEDAIVPVDVYSVEVVCWNPESNEVPARNGVQIVHIVTKARVAAVEDALDRFRRVHSAFLTEHGELPASVEDLRAFGIDDPDLYELDESEAGATVSTSGADQVYRCTSALGPSSDAEPECSHDFRRARSALRARYFR